MYLMGSVYNFCTYHKFADANLSARQPASLDISHPCHSCRYYRSPLDGGRVAVFSGAFTTLETAQTKRTTLKCHQIACRSVVFLTTVNWGATILPNLQD